MGNGQSHELAELSANLGILEPQMRRSLKRNELDVEIHGWDNRYISPNLRIESRNQLIIRNGKENSTDGVLGRKGYKRGIFLFEFHWKPGEDKNVVIGLANIKADISCPGRVSLFGKDGNSVGWDLVKRQIFYNGEALKTYPSQAFGPLPASITMVLNMTNGTLAFMSSNQDFGVAMEGIDKIGTSLYIAGALNESNDFLRATFLGGLKRVKNLLNSTLSGAQPEDVPLAFSPICNSKVRLSNNYKTAERIDPQDSHNWATTLTNRPLIEGETFAVRCDEQMTHRSQAWMVGVTTTAPEDMKFDRNITRNKQGDKWIYNESKIIQPTSRSVRVKQDLDNLVIGDVVGVRKYQGKLYFLVNGNPVADIKLDYEVHLYGFVDVYGKTTKVTIITSDPADLQDMPCVSYPFSTIEEHPEDNFKSEIVEVVVKTKDIADLEKKRKIADTKSGKTSEEQHSYPRIDTHSTPDPEASIETSSNLSSPNIDAESGPKSGSKTLSTSVTESGSKTLSTSETESGSKTLSISDTESGSGHYYECEPSTKDFSAENAHEDTALSSDDVSFELVDHHKLELDDSSNKLNRSLTEMTKPQPKAKNNLSLEHPLSANDGKIPGEKFKPNTSVDERSTSLPSDIETIGKFEDKLKTSLINPSVEPKVTKSSSCSAELETGHIAPETNPSAEVEPTSTPNTDPDGKLDMVMVSPETDTSKEEVSNSDPNPTKVPMPSDGTTSELNIHHVKRVTDAAQGNEATTFDLPATDTKETSKVKSRIEQFEKIISWDKKKRSPSPIGSSRIPDDGMVTTSDLPHTSEVYTKADSTESVSSNKTSVKSTTEEITMSIDGIHSETERACEPESKSNKMTSNMLVNEGVLVDIGDVFVLDKDAKPETKHRVESDADDLTHKKSFNEEALVVIEDVHVLEKKDTEAEGDSDDMTTSTTNTEGIPVAIDDASSLGKDIKTENISGYEGKFSTTSLEISDNEAMHVTPTNDTHALNISAIAESKSVIAESKSAIAEIKSAIAESKLEPESNPTDITWEKSAGATAARDDTFTSDKYEKQDRNCISESDHRDRTIERSVITGSIVDKIALEKYAKESAIAHDDTRALETFKEEPVILPDAFLPEPACASDSVYFMNSTDFSDSMAESIDALTRSLSQDYDMLAIHINTSLLSPFLSLPSVTQKTVVADKLANLTKSVQKITNFITEHLGETENRHMIDAKNCFCCLLDVIVKYCDCSSELARQFATSGLLKALISELHRLQDSTRESKIKSDFVGTYFTILHKCVRMKENQNLYRECRLERVASYYARHVTDDDCICINATLTLAQTCIKDIGNLRAEEKTVEKLVTLLVLASNTVQEDGTHSFQSWHCFELANGVANLSRYRGNVDYFMKHGVYHSLVAMLFFPEEVNKLSSLKALYALAINVHKGKLLAVDTLLDHVHALQLDDSQQVVEATKALLERLTTEEPKREHTMTPEEKPREKKDCDYRSRCIAYLRENDIEEDFFDPSHDHCYCDNCHDPAIDEPFGYAGDPPHRYGLPLGWIKLGLSLPPRAKGMKVLEKWHRAYHGTKIKSVASILNVGEIVPAGRPVLGGRNIREGAGHFNDDRKPDGFDTKQVFLSPSAVYAGHYSYARPDNYTDPITQTQYVAQVAFQVSVAPGSYEIGKQTVGERHIDPGFDDKELEWSTNIHGSSILLGLMVKLEKNDKRHRRRVMTSSDLDIGKLLGASMGISGMGDMPGMEGMLEALKEMAKRFDSDSD